MLRRAAQRLANSLAPLVENGATPSCSSSAVWEAARGISSSACSQRRLYPAAPPVRPKSVEAGPSVERSYLVDRYLATDLMARAELKAIERRRVIRDFERFPGDTGSTEVQVALLTQKIADMAEHMKQHRKDFSSRRGLEAMLHQRRKLLQYLRRSKFEVYAGLISRLGLKDSYGPSDRLSARYKPLIRGGGGSSGGAAAAP